MTAEIDDIIFGDRKISITIARSKRRRRTIGFVMDTPSALKITAPMRASLSSIRSALQKQTGWIKRRLAEFQKMGVAVLPTYREGTRITYLGRIYELNMSHDESLPQGCYLRPHRLNVNLHSEAPRAAKAIKSPSRLRATAKAVAKANLGDGLRHLGLGVGQDVVAKTQALTWQHHEGGQTPRPPSIPPASGREALKVNEEVRLEILLWLKRRAKVKFQKRMDFWAHRLGVRYQKLVVANAERRWGSCSSKNVIRLNWRLIMAPLPILDYVVVHELCHVQNKNHGPHFWRQVASVIPDCKNRRKHLRFMGGSLIL